MKPIRTTAAKMLARLQALKAPAVITKNKVRAAEKNFRPTTVAGRWFDGNWRGLPRRVTPGAAFGIHFVKRTNRVWLGWYERFKPSGSPGNYALVLNAVKCFEVADLDEPGAAQRELRGILQQEGAMIYSYYGLGRKREVKNGALTGLGLDADLENDLLDIANRYAGKPTTRQALVDARLGQGRYRADLLELWGGRCAVTGIAEQRAIVASHAMPWKLADDTQRRDPRNGLPLVATLDKLFGAGLIAFEPATGAMLVSPSLSAADRKLMGVPAQLRKTPTAAQAKYLRFHQKWQRKQKFKRAV